MAAVARHAGTIDDRRIAGFAALAISIHILEAALPMPLPGAKPGLANVVVLIVLLRHGFRAAAAVSLLRVVVGSLFVGSFLTPTFVLSLGGALASLAVVAMIRLVAARWTGAIGHAVGMAVAHMGGQFALAYALFLPHPALLSLLPALLGIATVLGTITGIIAARILERLPAPPA